MSAGSSFTPPPSSRPDEATTNHLLSLPPLLSPISPSLAALHMARVRLLYDIPTSQNIGCMTEWWCHSCGGLREGIGGTESQIGTRRNKFAKTRTGSWGQKRQDLARKRKSATCVNCGEKFKRGRPVKETLITYPSARIAARRKKEQQAVAQDVFSDPSTSTTQAVVTEDQIMTDDTAPSTPAAFVDPLTTTEVAKSRSPPSFNRVLNTEPNLPTYPPPAPSASPEKSKKKKKKSGLAKLLAENKERAAAQNLGGSWGLG